MRTDGNLGGYINYYPNSYGAFDSNKDAKQPALDLELSSVYEHNFREDDDHYYEQPGKLFRLQTPEQQERLFQNTAAEMNGTTTRTKHRHIFNCYQADPDYGKGVAKALGIDINDVDLENGDFFHSR